MRAGPLVERLTVAGVGLVGGSFAGAIRAAHLAREVVGFGRSETNLREAVTRGLVDRVTREGAEAAAADVIVVATPLSAYGDLVAALRPHARPGTLLTDVGSVKRQPLAVLEAAWADVGPVVGAHPIAGGERRGAGAARADLFRGSRCILTPTPATDPEALARVRALWEGVGAEVEEMAAAVHDDLLARASHLPHVVAYALASSTGAAGVAGRSALDYTGPGFRDATRIAASAAELWRDIALSNRPALLAALREFRDALGAIEQSLVADDARRLEALFAAARAVRRRLEPEG